MPTIREWYQRVNAAWPAEVPVMTFEQGANAVRRLYRYARGMSFSGEIRETGGNRYNYARRGIFFVNTGGYRHGGWKDLIHDLSHTLARRAYVDPIKPHSREHARMELRLVKEVVKRGWLKPVEPPKIILASPTFKKSFDVMLKLGPIEASIKRWETKRKRAETALKKLAKRKRYYERKVIA